MSDWDLVFNGLTMGQKPYGLENLVGFHEAPDLRASDAVRSRSHGEFAGTDLLGGRTISASIIVTATHPNSAIWQALSQALVVGQSAETTLTATLPGVASGVTVQVSARVRRLSLPINMEYTLGLGRAEVEWRCTDPRIYDANETVVGIVQATSSGGLLFNATFDLDFGGDAVGGVGSATNTGEFGAPWTAVITGPITNPRIENVTTGTLLSFAGTLSATDTLTVSSFDKSIILNSAASRYSWLVTGSRWFDLAPGLNQVRLAGASGSGSMTLTFRSAWI